MKRNLVLKSMLFYSMIIFLGGCDTSFDDLVVQDTSFDIEVENSKNFKKYKTEYVELVSQMREVIDRTSDSDAQKIIDLYNLYKSDPQRYKELFEYQVKNIVGKDSTLFVKKVEEVNIEKIKVMEHLKLKRINDLGRGVLTNNLMNSAYQYSIKEIPITRVKTPTEITDCQQYCEEDRDDDIEFANDMTGCATAVNTLTCLLTAGGSSLVWWVAEFGIAYVHDKTVKKAWEDYEKCIERCKS